MPYAIDELPHFVAQLTPPLSPRDAGLRYICAMLSELVYYHLTDDELDPAQRSRLVPCDVYDRLAAVNATRSVAEAFGGFAERDLPFETFVTSTHLTVVVGLQVRRVLFVAFRGTRFMFDWRINFRSSLTQHPGTAPYFPGRFLFHGGHVHSGFFEEANRISLAIHRALRARGLTGYDHLVLTGHSLGGAVSALSQFEWPSASPPTVCLFGAPRYCDAAFIAARFPDLPTQVHRRGDLVPRVPLRLLGYVDHPDVIMPDGTSRWPDGPTYRLWQWFLGYPFIGPVRFAVSCGSPHNIELYRRDCGATAHASLATHPLAPLERLRAP